MILEVIPGESRPAPKAKTFWQTLEEVATTRGIDLRTVLDVTPATIRRWKNGGTPPSTTLRYYAWQLGLDRNAFLNFRAARPAA
jgi:hypothetical protein